MINEQLTDPKSIVIIGGSNDIHKPGGKVLKNLLDGNYKGKLYVTNLKESEVQGIKSFSDVAELPEVDLAIIAIKAKLIPQAVKILTEEKNTRAIIILSAGFSEENEEGKKLEEEVVQLIDKAGGSLIGPNCIGVLTPEYHGVFTSPIPKLDLNGCDFISGSGATACFIMEAGIPKGLPFARVFSVGNSAQMGVEETLKYMDETFDPNKSPRIKLLYIENIDKPMMLLKHASSLINKGCKIAAIKAGTTEAGSRAASSHTGALASPDLAVEALFRKAGIVRCYGREDLIAVASVFLQGELKGNNFAVITHAGGPAVMLTDELSKGGLNVPHLKGKECDKLLEELFPGSSVANPIDFLATGNAEQLGKIIDCVDGLEEIDAMVVIFGTAGLNRVFDVYDVLDEKRKTAKKPIYTVLPSVHTADEEIQKYISKSGINFPDEVHLGKALSKVFHASSPYKAAEKLPGIDENKIRSIIKQTTGGYISPENIQELLDAVKIPRAGERVVKSLEEALKGAHDLGYPIVMKVIGPVHKSDVGGVSLNIKDNDKVKAEFKRMMQIPDTTAILMQPMLKGTELFIGAKEDETFGHMVLCGLGGIFVEVLKDISAGLIPLCENEATAMIQSLQSYDIIKGTRGQDGVNEKVLSDIIVRLSALLKVAPEIKELDLNPLLGTPKTVVAVDARIRIEK